MSPAPAGAATYQVSELAGLVRGLIDDSLPSLWVEGEISNFSRPASGHWYFTLKDAHAQLRCAMFKNRNLYVRPQPREGDRVRVKAKLDFYPGRGDLQLICDALEPAGEGAILAALEKLKKKLAAEGLFEASRKRPLPAAPRNIGVITSATGAAVQDIRATLARRWPLATLWLWPVPVQGVEAAPAIVKALQALPAAAPVDVILLARGGGSLEDLLAFSDEAVVRAVAACASPVVSGVGHEVDFSLADFAADLRAPTPTAAAELATPRIDDMAQRVEDTTQALTMALHQRLRDSALALRQQHGRLVALHPGRRLQERQQRFDELHERLIAATPVRRLSLLRGQLDQLDRRAALALRQSQMRREARWQTASTQLVALNPKAVLARGYALALTADGHIATDAAALRAGERLHIQLAHGAVDSIITADKPDAP